MTKARTGTLDELLAETEPALHTLVLAARELVREVHPDVVEVVRLGDRAVSWGVGPKKMSESHSYVIPYKGWVNLGFYRGAGLPDPAGLLEGTGAAMRHVKVRTLADLQRPEVRELLQAALAERKAALGR
ncbi:MAG: DUF1801 domain-containing protein [Alphaproteobacteria bacterium]|nr:DUF1801 domain-containing protein [Alphaproteobacteria bacterium]MCB9692477.1 DUF1801 domain-containing protein [Alphaproteobacteria bacterium]